MLTSNNKLSANSCTARTANERHYSNDETMTASTPRSCSDDVLLLMPDASLSAKFSVERDDVLETNQQSCLPPSLPFSPRASSHGIPAMLALPTLAPRAQKERQIGDAMASQAGTLMDFVSHMSLNDIDTRREFLSNRPTAPEPPLAFSLAMEPRSDDDDDDDGYGYTRPRATSNSANLQPPNIPWSLTTPETMKATISTPQGIRVASHKRKSPVVHSTPVNGNRPLMLPTLNSTRQHARPSSDCCADSFLCHNQQGRCKKAKSYNDLLSSAPMLPASPDLEDRTLIAPSQFHIPSSSAAAGGDVEYSAPAGSYASMSPPPSLPMAMMAGPPTRAARLPRFDLAEQRSAPKWLRMKRRQSLLCALRLAASET